MANSRKIRTRQQEEDIAEIARCKQDFVTSPSVKQGAHLSLTLAVVNEVNETPISEGVEISPSGRY
jgi:hypothetical protein